MRDMKSSVSSVSICGWWGLESRLEDLQAQNREPPSTLAEHCGTVDLHLFPGTKQSPSASDQAKAFWSGPQEVKRGVGQTKLDLKSEYLPDMSLGEHERSGSSSRQACSQLIPGAPCTQTMPVSSF